MVVGLRQGFGFLAVVRAAFLVWDGSADEGCDVLGESEIDVLWKGVSIEIRWDWSGFGERTRSLSQIRS